MVGTIRRATTHTANATRAYVRPKMADGEYSSYISPSSCPALSTSGRADVYLSTDVAKATANRDEQAGYKSPFRRAEGLVIQYYTPARYYPAVSTDTRWRGRHPIPF